MLVKQLSCTTCHNMPLQVNVLVLLPFAFLLLIGADKMEPVLCPPHSAPSPPCTKWCTCMAHHTGTHGPL